jgi:hypothetical protein
MSLAVLTADTHHVDHSEHRAEAPPELLKRYWESPATPAVNLDPSALLKKALS